MVELQTHNTFSLRNTVIRRRKNLEAQLNHISQSDITKTYLSVADAALYSLPEFGKRKVKCGFSQAKHIPYSLRKSLGVSIR